LEFLCFLLDFFVSKRFAFGGFSRAAELIVVTDAQITLKDTTERWYISSECALCGHRGLSGLSVSSGSRHVECAQTTPEAHRNNDQVINH
jgi:hypothetical protein